MVYQKIAEYIEDIGINKAAIARKIGMEKQSFYQCLSGDRKISADEYVAICAALQVPLDRFAQENQLIKA